ncbi:2-succinyl-5-enolpyruvyl-6-hydroxy-3-cyclohexene-1-carboxylic-acid synthase [Ectobacillus sp. sgz5001026]|uniref:2-succinyl-5-enolpyruvyl-6-hydroxy-3- cyclohexene-1-carboxylic-acid synthase n=1 Tax=Ectobacillus sp. sgz5001026 TaxID=3242473 RepID=UPI0036D265BD
MSHTEALTYYLGSFVDELAYLHVRDVVISPGSRSTPLALLMAEHADITTYLHVDERSAAFFALGMAKAKKQPVVLLCTSGTAAANYFPAVCEAFHSRVPLLVLTADRPHELRDVEAPQAMNQIELYGSFVKKSFELALPESSDKMYRYIRSSAKRAIMLSKDVPNGPVHLNFPIREPLLPDFSLPDIWNKGKVSSLEMDETSIRVPSKHYVETLANRLSYLDKGIIVCGDQNDPLLAQAVTELARTLQYPILADSLSQLRCGYHDKTFIIDCYDTFLRNESISSNWKPDVVIRLGAMPVSKALSQFISKQDAALHITVDEAVAWRDPGRITNEMIHANETQFCKELAEKTKEKRESNWIRSWKMINQVSKKHLLAVQDDEHPFEGKVITEVAHLLPDKGALFLSNSMPIRDADTFLLNEDKELTIYANRGVNGIDGVISTALGTSISSEPLVLVIGDLAFYHDLNGLLAAKLHQLNATIVIVNNDGGGIFSFLPQHEQQKHFETLFGTPLGLDYEHVVKMYGGTFSRPQSWQQFREYVKDGIALQGLHVIEWRTDRESNMRMHRDLWTTISKEIDNVLRHD